MLRLTAANQEDVFTTVPEEPTRRITPALSLTRIAKRPLFPAAATPRRTTFSNATTCMHGSDEALYPIDQHIQYCVCTKIWGAHKKKASWNCITKKKATKKHCHLTTADFEDVKATVIKHWQMAFYITVTISLGNVATAFLTAALIPCISTAKYWWWPPPNSTPLRHNRWYASQQEAK